jgi:1,6-anhydro-N-acetylmuramate kinase
VPPTAAAVEAVCRLDTRLGQAFERAARAGVALAGGAVDLVVSHGQTVYHWVSGGRALGTLQLGAPAWIAAATGIPVLSDLRSADIARLRDLGAGRWRLRTSDELGVPARANEAHAFALLGWLSWHGLPGSVAPVTGARRAAVLRSWTPGGALPPRPVVPGPPRRLRVAGRRRGVNGP